MKFPLSALKQAQPILNFTAGKFAVEVPFLRPKDKVVFVMGATGTGKSRLAIDVASRFPAEIINSDKIQVYKGLNVVTNKVTTEECRGVPHHLLGVIDPNANFTSTDFQLYATRAVESTVEKDKLPIVAGGSNSYIEALVNHSAEFRLRYQCCFLWVDVSLPVLKSFVSKRVDRMMEAGLVDEVREFYDPKGDYSIGIRRAIGVPELHQYFRSESQGDRGTQSKLLDIAVKKIKENTEILACRQLQKIHRLYKKWNWCMHRIDATEVFLRYGEEADEAWEKLVARPSARIVDKFILEEDRLATVVLPDSTLAVAAAAAAPVPLAVATYLGESRAHNMV